MGLRPKGDRHEPRMPISREEFGIVMSVFQQVLKICRPEETPSEESGGADAGWHPARTEEA